MAEPTTSAAALFSITKVWSILASVCGSIIPVMALSDKNKIGIRNGLFMAATGSSFAIFVGPWVAEYFKIISVEAIAGLSWTMGALGVYLIRAVLSWIENRGVSAIDRIFTKAIGTSPALETENNNRDPAVGGPQSHDKSGE